MKGAPSFGRPRPYWSRLQFTTLAWGFCAMHNEHIRILQPANDGQVLWLCYYSFASDLPALFGSRLFQFWKKAPRLLPNFLSAGSSYPPFCELVSPPSSPTCRPPSLVLLSCHPRILDTPSLCSWLENHWAEWLDQWPPSGLMGPAQVLEQPLPR